LRALGAAWQRRRELPQFLNLFAHACDLAWLCVYPLVAFAAGIFMLGWVDQTREFYLQFSHADNDMFSRISHVFAFLAALLIWATSVWYGMRVLLARRYQNDVVPAAGEHLSSVIRTWAPRWFGYFGLLSATFTFAAYGQSVSTVAPFVALAVLHLGVHLIAARIARERYGAKLAAGMPVFACTLAVFLVSMTIFGQFLPAVTLAAKVFVALWAMVAVVNLLSARLAFYVLVLALACGAAWYLAPVQGGWLGPKGAAVLASLFYVAVVVRRDALAWLIGSDAPRAGSLADRMPLGTRITLGVVMLALAAAVAGSAMYPHALAAPLGSLAIVFLGFALWSLAAALIFVHIPKAYGAPSLALLPLVFAFVVSGDNDNHGLPAQGVQPVVDPRPTLEDDFAGWLKAREAQGDAKDAPVVLVAAAGGGQRAGWWTARVLAEADEASCGAFGRRIYAISGVSGGSLGAASYAALKAQGADTPAAGKPCLGTGEFSTQVDRFIGHDHLAPVAGSMLFADALQRFTPFAWLDNDRGNVLVQSWAHAWQEQFDTDRFNAPQADLYKSDSARRVPLLLFNATSIDSGRRVLATTVQFNPPDVLDLYGAGLRTAGLPLGFAVLNSARFTYVSPAATVHAGAPGSAPSVVDRLVDGGYFDNSGMDTILDLAGQLVRSGKVARENLLIVIINNDATLDPICPHDALPQAPEPGIDRAWGAPVAGVPRLSETLAPVSAILATRSARSSLAMRRMEIALRAPGGAAGSGCDQILEWGLYASQYKAMQLDGRREPALGWFVSDDSKRVIAKFSGFYAGQLPPAFKKVAARP
jgi:predicted acylesterase/phospholipase RssA